MFDMYHCRKGLLLYGDITNVQPYCRHHHRECPMRDSLNKVSFSAGGTNNDKLAEREGGNCAHVTCVYPTGCKLEHSASEFMQWHM